MKFWDGYLGTSFTELLQAEHPDLRTDIGHFRQGDERPVPTAHGTTVLGVRFAGGVLVAGDRLATMDYRVASRDIQKVYATDDYSLMAIAGAAGPSIEMARLLRIQFEHYEKIEGESLELEGKANVLSGMIRQNLPAAMQGLVVVPIFAGYDRRRRTGRVWKYEITGGRYEEEDFDATGSGSLFARESLKKSFSSNASRDEVLRIAIEALTDAADEDRGTGGVDTLRGLYPTMKLATEKGIEDVGDEEIAGIYEGVLTARRQRIRFVSFPFYVSPEQMTQDKAEFARKGIARGRSLVTMEFGGGIAMVAENPLQLSKIGEIYDRIAFAGVGKYSEFDRLRKIGVQHADMEGYRFSRDDVRGKALANVFSQVIGEEFTRSMKPLEVEIVIAEVGDPDLAGHEKNNIYKVQFDGSIADLKSFCVIGGSVDNLQGHMEAHWRDGLPLGDAIRLGREALQRANGTPDLPAESLEVCVLERERRGRKFRRLSADELRGMLSP